MFQTIKLCLILLVFVLAGSGTTHETEKINRFISTFAKANHFSGVVLASKDNKIVYKKAFGLANAEHNIPNKLNTQFGIASVTKHMTKAIAIRLAEEGKLKLDDKLVKFIPDFPNGDKITVLLLIRHRAGVKHRVTKPEEEAVPYTPAEMTEKAKLVPLAFQADGNRRLYSSAGYSVLARVLEIASGKPYSQLLEEYVFRPLEMKNSFDFNGKQIIKNRAQEYLLRSNGFIHAPLKDYSFLVGAGSVFSTVEDIYKFGEGILNNKLGANVKASLIDGEGIYDDNGNTNGFRCYFKIDRKKGYGFVLMANMESGANNILVQTIPKLLQNESVSAPKIPDPKITLKINENLDEFTGKYSLSSLGFELVNSKGELFFGRYQLFPIGKNKFFVFEDYGEITFFRNNNGVIEKFKWETPVGTTEWIKRLNSKP